MKGMAMSVLVVNMFYKRRLLSIQVLRSCVSSVLLSRPTAVLKEWWLSEKQGQDLAVASRPRSHSAVRSEASPFCPPR